MDFNLYKKNSRLYKNTKRIFIIFSIVSFVLGIGLSVCNIFVDKSRIIDGLILFVFLFPLEILLLRNDKVFKDESIAYIKYIVLKKVISKKRLDEYNKAHIRVIMLSNDDVNYKIDTYKKDEVNGLIFKSNVLIRNCDISDIKKYIRDYSEEDNYDEILRIRGLYDNYLKRINFYIICYLSFILCNILFVILGYPFEFNYLIMLLVKISNVLVNKFVYSNMKIDSDIMKRSIRDRGKLFYFQELMIVLMQSFFIFFGLGIVYIYFMTNLMDINISYTIFIMCYIYMLLWITIVNMNEKILIINVIKSYNNISLLIYILGIIVSSVLLLNIKFFDLYKLSFRAIIGCVFYSLVFVVISDVFKLARYTTIKKVKVKKNEIKNN